MCEKWILLEVQIIYREGGTMYIPENIKFAINQMFSCHGMDEHMACYQHYYEELKDCMFVVFSDTEGTQLPSTLCTNYDNEFAIINLGCTNRYYAVNAQIYEEMLRTGESNYYIDVCVDLDTQAVSYLKNVFVKYDQIPEHEKIRELIQYLHLPEVNYSCLPYLIENTAKKGEIDYTKCYKNLYSFMLFKAFNYKKLLHEGICEYNKLEEEIFIDADGLYNDMRSEKFAHYYGDFWEMQKSIYILLLKAICIEFTNSKKSAKNKMLELLDFVNNKLGFIPEREIEICYHYFNHEDATKKFFKRAQKNSNNLFEAIRGMAWDLVHIRLIESEFLARPVEEARYAIHILLTFDNGLKEILQINPIEQIAFYEGISIPKLKTYWIADMPEVQEKILNKENIAIRRQTFETRDVKQLQSVLERDLLYLCKT